MARSVSRLGGILLAAFFLAPTGEAFAQRGRSLDAPPGGPAKNNPRIVELFKPVVAKVSESTVDILEGEKSVALGTVVAEYFILTKDSELRTENVAIRTKDGKEYPARKVSTNEIWDLALLKVEVKGLKPVKWDDSKLAPVGNWIATAAPAEKPIAIGVVSVASRAMPPGPKIALPKNNNERGYLGIQMEDNEGGITGVKIVVVSPKSPAEKAGLKENDIILAVNGKETPDRETLGATIGRNKPGDTVTVRFRRGDKEDEIKATLEKRPAGLGMDRGDFQNSMGTDRSERRTGFPHALQHDTDLKASQCGGPIVDLEGRVIGINIARGGRTDTYAIPSEILRPVINEMISAKGPVTDAVKALADRIKAAELVVKEAETEKLNAEKKFNEAKSALEKLVEEQKKMKK